MEKKRNLWVIPTDKPSRIYYNNNDQKLQFCEVFKKSTPLKENQNIYITSDKEIQKGDWCLADYVTGFTDLKGNPCNDGSYYIVKVNNIVLGNVEHGQQLLFSFNNLTHELRFCKKIILTTDQDLINDGVQAIDDSFLEWFVKNPSCEFVEVEFGLYNPLGRKMDHLNLHQNLSTCVWRYKILIPNKYPIGGYAPGYYSCDCITCKIPFQGDKRAVQCEPCAVKMVNQDSKKETIEDIAQKKYPNNGLEEEICCDLGEYARSFFIEGAKEQAKRMYSDEEMEDIIIKTVDKFCSYFSTELKVKTAKEWFEQIKKQ